MPLIFRFIQDTRCWLKKELDAFSSGARRFFDKVGKISHSFALDGIFNRHSSPHLQRLKYLLNRKQPQVVFVSSLQSKSHLGGGGRGGIRPSPMAEDAHEDSHQ